MHLAANQHGHPAVAQAEQPDRRGPVAETCRVSRLDEQLKQEMWRPQVGERVQLLRVGEMRGEVRRFLQLEGTSRSRP